jgi:hypothetical protein
VAMARILSKAGRKPGDEIEDRGCRYAPTCAGCPWRECYYVLGPADKKAFKLAWRVLESFRAAPERTIPR